MSTKIDIGIVGGAGYTAGELIRILLNHPMANIVFILSKSNAGNLVSDVHADLTGETRLRFTGKPIDDVDVVFLCVGHGEARRYLEENEIRENVKIIDLSQDFRLPKDAVFGHRQFVYGLPEWNREKIKMADSIANPGCFATAIQLGLLPLAQAGLLDEVYTTGITGSTGAGQGMSTTSHFSWRANNIQAYKTLAHQHLGEIGESLTQWQPGKPVALNFVPWRGDFTRGIFTSSQIKCNWPAEKLTQLYEDYYRLQPFTVLCHQNLFLKQVVNTNKCMIQLERINDMLVVHSAIDNLLKGASGQAVQNMNLLMGLEETAGLKLKAGYF
jgi:N-acetyl-gamma-glutamyl-phosphate reductase